MQAKYKIDRDTRTLVLKYIRKYDEYLLWYKSERDRLMSPSREIIGLSTSKGSGISDPTASTVEALQRLDDSHRVQVINAIDQAKLCIGTNIVSEREVEALRRAIWLSCLNSSEYNFEAFAGAICCERAQFYRYKNAFLNDIKRGLGI